MGRSYKRRYKKVEKSMIKRFLKRLFRKCEHEYKYVGSDGIRKYYRCNNCGKEERF